MAVQWGAMLLPVAPLNTHSVVVNFLNFIGFLLLRVIFIIIVMILEPLWHLLVVKHLGNLDREPHGMDVVFCISQYMCVFSQILCLLQSVTNRWCLFSIFTQVKRRCQNYVSDSSPVMSFPWHQFSHLRSTRARCNGWMPSVPLKWNIDAKIMSVSSPQWCHASHYFQLCVLLGFKAVKDEWMDGFANE